jgi:hypothetical protein
MVAFKVVYDITQNTINGAIVVSVFQSSCLIYFLLQPSILALFKFKLVLFLTLDDFIRLNLPHDLAERSIKILYSSFYLKLNIGVRL